MLRSKNLAVCCRQGEKVQKIQCVVTLSFNIAANVSKKRTFPKSERFQKANVSKKPIWGSRSNEARHHRTYVSRNASQSIPAIRQVILRNDVFFGKTPVFPTLTGSVSTGGLFRPGP
jgi:hypothetical protein